MTRTLRPHLFHPRTGEYNNGGQEDFSGMAVCLVVFCLGTCPYWVILFVFFNDYGSIQFPLEDTGLLTPPEYRSVKESMISLLIRVLLTAPSIIEIFRLLAFVLPAAYVLLNAAMQMVDYFANDMRDAEEFLSYYIPFQLAYRYVEYPVGDLLFTVLTFDFWGLTFGLWFIIQGYDLINPVMYGCLVGGAVIALLSTSFAFLHLKKSTGRLDRMVWKNRMMSSATFVETKSRKAKGIKKRVEAVTKFKLRYGSFSVLESKFGLHFFANMVDRLFDFLLVFDVDHIIELAGRAA